MSKSLLLLGLREDIRRRRRANGTFAHVASFPAKTHWLSASILFTFPARRGTLREFRRRADGGLCHVRVRMCIFVEPITNLQGTIDYPALASPL